MNAAVGPQANSRGGKADLLRGIVFDMGDILFDAATWRRWLYRLLRQLGMADSYADVFGKWDRDYLDAVHRGQRQYHEAFAAFLTSCGFSAAQIDEVVAASMARKREIEAGVRPFAGVKPTLKRLREHGLSLAVLSDSESTAEQIRQRLERLEIGSPFSAVVSSFDLGRTKPAAACYRAALGALGVAPREAMFVGHDLDELQGAAAVGMRTVAYNHSPGTSADFQLRRFEELAPLARRLRGRLAVETERPGAC